MKFQVGHIDLHSGGTGHILTADGLSGQMQRKLLQLASAMTLVIALSYVAYFATIGIWISAGRGLLAVLTSLAVLWFGMATKNYKAALNILSISLFFLFGLATYLQDGVFSPALWWMITPPMISLLAGSLGVSGVLFGAFLVHTVLLYWHGPGSWGQVSLMAKNRELQMVITVVFSTIFMGIFVGMGRRWLHEVQKALELARLAAYEASEVKARFLSNMSHEIRTPLNGMIGATQMLRSQKVTALQRRQLLTVQEQSAKMLMSLVNDILDFSKLEAQKVQIEHADTRVRSVLFHVNELFSVAAFERGIELSSSYDPAVPETLLADSTRLRQILGNLVSNAVKFTERGGVHIHLGFDKSASNPAQPAGTHWLRFDVSDTGLGIDAKVIPSLFQPFEQADGSITRRYGGTGLGLSISNELACLMNGRIDVASKLGEGSVFSLVVPLEAVDAAPARPEAQSLPGRLLVVTRSKGLWKHVQLQLDELGVAAIRVDEMPDLVAAYRARAAYVLVDAQILRTATPGMVQMVDDLVDAGMRVAVMTPLGGDALVQPYKRAALLYKPIRRGGLHEFVFGDEELNVRQSQEVPHGIESAFDDAAGTEASAAVRLHKPPKGLTVLVAEDNPVNQIIARAMLSDMDAKVITVSNGREALEMLTTTSVDVILMDVQMPEMDGITTTRLLRESERRTQRAATPVIAITGNNASEERQACLEAGMNSFLTKPYTLEQLRKAMAQNAIGQPHA